MSTIRGIFDTWKKCQGRQRQLLCKHACSLEGGRSEDMRSVEADRQRQGDHVFGEKYNDSSMMRYQKVFLLLSCVGRFLLLDSYGPHTGAKGILQKSKKPTAVHKKNSNAHSHGALCMLQQSWKWGGEEKGAEEDGSEIHLCWLCVVPQRCRWYQRGNKLHRPLKF